MSELSKVSVFDMACGKAALCLADEIAPADAIQTVNCRKDARLCLRAGNTDGADIVVCIKAGNGPRAVLGDKEVTVGAGEIAYIPLFDTARFKSMDSGTVTVELYDADGEALGETALQDVTLEAVQM